MAHDWWDELQKEKARSNQLEKRLQVSEEGRDTINGALVSIGDAVGDGRLSGTDMIMVQEYKAKLAALDTRRAILIAMAPGLTHTVSASIGLTLGIIIGYLY